MGFLFLGSIFAGTIWSHLHRVGQCLLVLPRRRTQRLLNLAVRPRAAVDLCDYSLHTVIWYTIIVKIQYWLHLIYDCLLKIRTMVGEDNRDVLLSFPFYLLKSWSLVLSLLWTRGMDTTNPAVSVDTWTQSSGPVVQLAVRRYREHYCVSSQTPLRCISIQLGAALCDDHSERITFGLIRLNQT